MGESYQARLWTELSDTARAVAKTVRDPDLKLQILLVAARYLVWAKRFEQEGEPIHRRSNADC